MNIVFIDTLLILVIIKEEKIQFLFFCFRIIFCRCNIILTGLMISLFVKKEKLVSCFENGQTDGWISQWMNGRMDGKKDEWMDGRVNGWMERRMNGWMEG